MAEGTGEYNYPTVREGSRCLIVFVGAIVFKMVVYDANTELNHALAALLAAASTTHAILTLGGGFIKSKWAGDTPTTPQMIEKTTTEKTVVTPTQPASMEVKPDANVSQN